MTDRRQHEFRRNNAWPVFFAGALILGATALFKFGLVLVALFCANLAFIFYCRGDAGLRRWSRDLSTDKHPKLLQLAYRAQIVLLGLILLVALIEQI